MKKTRLYLIAIVALLILNLVQLAIPFFLHGPPRGEGAKFNATEILHLNKDQEGNFDNIAKAHQHKMVEIQNHQKKLTEEYFATSNKKFLNEICALEVEKIKFTNTHFEEVKSILNKDQIQYYQDFKNKAVNIIIN
ncbi:hypothetical protein [Frigoriflavimonas asaccharolytica]|uniref:Heavy-metal resistance protein n=1 Tax=Frigoriflavimonas asaccharolytica TaxID=2735899 RepID=A0A8J8G5Y3_9FLAO|nr:hypothetical protein [Frigoriflavimonas asaccharolytica]NRS92098.1 hypothetical protein [Frigoriflavimonas asaccharolytica]